ncbi:unnamed protein product [Rotaria socialis]|uniref:FLYWCH-type domain-containing protein n=1 Tax=Rotaria socialis TaxID=392032 RepID=A0A819YPR9_9BILA|nr:unnamed protein product [Rotaria socialis]
MADTATNAMSSSLSSTPVSVISFLTSNKGKPLLVYNNHLFRCNKIVPLKKYWVCNTRGSNVFVHTSTRNEFLSINGNHNHASEPHVLDVKKEIKQASLSHEATAAVLSVIEFRSNMSKTRRKQTSVIPKSCAFDLPLPYQQTIAGQRFLFMDYFVKRAKERVLLFSSDEQLNLLFSNDIIFMDGTFSTAPSNFDQVFLIHIQNFNQGLPVVFCLLPNRRAATYAEMFERLKQEAMKMNKTFDPEKNTVHRNIRALGLASEYNNDETVREQCKGLIALSFMPVSEVEQQFNRIRALALPALEELFIYFERQWIKGNIPLVLWNSSQCSPRTNNISEAYNRRFGSCIAKTHPSLWTYIKLIQDEHVRFEHMHIQLTTDISSSKQSKNKSAFERRYEVLNNRFKNGEINSKQLLSALTLLLAHKKNLINTFTAF